MNKRFYTSESVTEGHPDKVCDQISDAVLDEILRQDMMARVACETAVTTGLVLIMGEITTECYVDIPKIARSVILDIGYNDAKMGFDGNTCAVITSIDEQSPDISRGVDSAYDLAGTMGAGDQGMMFGYACDETKEYMPMPIAIAHALTKRLAQARKSGEMPYLRPDGKAQVTVEYEDGVPKRLDTVVLSTQHSPDIEIGELRHEVLKRIIEPTVDKSLLTDTRFLINPTGRFVVGGPMGDSGLTGRKIIVDTYGGYSRHGGGAFSGKDPTKVDRSASYAARYIAKNIVAAGLAKKCELVLSYAIGVAAPIRIDIDTFGTGVIPDEEIGKIVRERLDLTPGGIINMLQLRRPIYRQVSTYGHFGRDDLNLPWEKLDLGDVLAL